MKPFPRPAGLVFQRHHYLTAHPASVRGRSDPGSPGGSGSGPERGGRSDPTERAAGQPGHLPHPGPDRHGDRADPVADLPGSVRADLRMFGSVFIAWWLTCVTCEPAGSGRPVTPGAAVAAGPGAGAAADLSSGADPPAGPDGPGHPAQPPDGHRQLCNTIRSPVHTRRGRKQSSRYWTLCKIPNILTHHIFSSLF